MPQLAAELLPRRQGFQCRRGGRGGCGLAARHRTGGFDAVGVHHQRQVVDAGHAAGKHVSICGEMAGDPVATVLLIAMYGLFKALDVEFEKQLIQHISPPTVAPMMRSQGAWRERLHVMMHLPNQQEVHRFIDHTIKNACEELATEWQQLGTPAQVQHPTSGKVLLNIQQADDMDFTYQIIATAHQAAEQTYYRAEIYLHQGGQDGVINDIIDQFHKHQHLLHRLR